MRISVLALCGCLAVGGASMRAQMMGGEEVQPPPLPPAPQAETARPDAMPSRPPRTSAGKTKSGAGKTVSGKSVGAPLTQRERALHLLDRFTYGARPGDVDTVMAMGTDAWLERQLMPDAIPDAALSRRLGDYPTLNMQPDQAIRVFPDRQMVYAVADGKLPYPADPLLASVYEVQVWKWREELSAKNNSAVQPTDAEKAEKKKQQQATAARVAGELLALPRQQRMAALIALPVEDRAAFAGGGNVPKEEDDLLFADDTPREREAVRAMSGQVSASYYLTNELAQARVLRDVISERQLQEVMTDFWFNHFNVYINKDSDQWYTATYERDVIRKHALGKFRDLLMATAESPAMMVYLDNWLSIGPDSLANGVNPQKPNAKKGNKGLNENYGREVMELHTVGVKGGYTQADVTALSAILTGWGVDQPGRGGPFVFDAKKHEPGPKTWLGYQIEDDGKISGKTATPVKPGQTFGTNNVPATDDGMQQGVTALNILASSPQTAHFLSYLLAQKFVADDPPPTLVDRLTTVFENSDGDIKEALRALIASPEFNSRQYYRNKVKTPVEFVASAFRSTATDPQNPGAMVDTLRRMGMPLYLALPPTGYYLTADQWMNSAALVDRLNFAYQLTNNKFANQKFDAPKLLAMGLLAPSAEPRDGKPRVMGVAAVTGPMPTGADTALRVLEQTVIGGSVSPRTNDLIHKQMEQQPPNASATDTLNLLTALVLGSPEFQMR